MGRDKATDPRIKSVARQMVADHTLMLNDLKRVATRKNMTVTGWANGAGMGSDMSGDNTMSGTSGRRFRYEQYRHNR
jgi:hypothetical protein